MAKENNYNVLAKPVARRGRNSFNLNNQHVYSMKAGLLNPVKAIHFMPGDFYKLKANDFTLTFPMNSAPFLRMRKEFSFYSVYHNAVWSLFNQYMAGRQDPKSSAFGVNPVLQEPRIKLINLFAYVLNQFGAYIFLEYYLPTYAEWYDEGAHNDYSTIVNNAKKVFFDDEYDQDYKYSTVIDYGTGVSTTLVWNLNSLVLEGNPLSWSAFNAESWNVIEDVAAHNDNIYQDVVGHYRWSNQLRKLDMYGYGNLYPLFNQAERNIINAIEKFKISEEWSADDGWSYFSTLVNMEVVAIIRTMVNSFCTWTADTATPAAADITSYKMVNLYPLCEHNSIFYHFFRNSFYDNNYFSHDYSLDFVSASSGGSGYNEVSMSDFSVRFLDCEYHQWKKDMFTSVLPDEQFGAVSSINLNVVGINTGNDYQKHSLSDIVSESNSNDTGIIHRESLVSNNSNLITYVNETGYKRDLHTHYVPGQSLSFDMIALKRAEMLQEYRQTLMRAGNKTSDVFRALYGGAPSSEHLDDIIPRFLETFGEDLVVDPVIATANTEQGENGKLGDISARAKASGSSREFKFDAGNNFGCIIVMAYVVPTSMYNSYMVDKHLYELTPEQHFIPNFENCGLEDVYSDELNILLPANKLQSLGKQARYYHKKTDVDKVHGAFCAVPTYAILTEGDPIPVDVKDTMYYGEFNHWISARTDMQARAVTSRRDFYINPSVLDNIFVRATGADQADDQFICTTLIEVDATKQISKVGLVNFV